MKKTLCALLAVCAVGMTLASCAKKAEEGFQKVESGTCDFAFECPETWTVTHTDGMLSVINPEDISKANITAHSFSHGEGESTTAIEYWETYQKQLSDVFANCEFEQVQPLSLGGQETAHAKYSVNIGKESFDCETVLIVYAGKAYTITLTQGAKTDENAENYNDHSDEFAEIIKTFRIK